MAKSIRTTRSYLAFVYDAGGGTSYRVSGKAIIVSDAMATTLAAYGLSLDPPIPTVAVDSVNPPTPPDTNYVTQDELTEALGALPAASTTTPGVVELATATEAKGLADTTRAVTAAGLGAVITDVLPGTFASMNPTISGVTLDGEGNRTAWTENGVSCSATYDSDGNMHTLTVAGVTRTFTYDANGNQTGAA